MPKLLCLGTVGMDVLMKVDSLPEADSFGVIESSTYLPGGSGTNVAAEASRMGMDTTYIAKIGDDRFGKDILMSLEDEGIKHHTMVIKEHGISLHTYIVIDSKGEKFILLNLGDSFGDLRKEEVSAQAIASCDVFFTDLFPKEPSLFALELAKEKGKKTVFNMQTGLSTLQAFGFTKEDVLNSLKWVDVFAPSREGLKDLFGEEDPRLVLKEIRKYFSGIILSTQGAKGVIYIDEEDTVGEVFSLTVDVKDTTGAGDTFLGAFISSYFNDHRALKEAVTYANAAAAYTCQSIGARTGPTTDQLKQFLENYKGESHEV